MPTTLTAEQVGDLNIQKAELQAKHTASLGKINEAIALAEKIAVDEVNLNNAKAQLAALDAEVAQESAGFANFFLEKAGL